MKDDRQFVTALARGLDVLRCFTLDRPELTTTEIAGLTDLPQPTAWRLCYTLSRLGYLVRAGKAERFRVSPVVLSLGHAVVTQTGVAEFARPLMRKIADEFDASVSLATRDRLNMVIVQRTEAPSILRLSLHVGVSLSLPTSALGWAYLAGVDKPERDEVLRSIRRAHPGQFDKIADDIRTAMAQYAETGVVFNLRQYHPDVNAIGVPVIAPYGGKVMALNCGGASSIVTEEKLAGPIAQALKKLAADIAPAVTEDPAVLHRPRR